MYVCVCVYIRSLFLSFYRLISYGTCIHIHAQSITTITVAFRKDLTKI